MCCTIARTEPEQQVRVAELLDHNVCAILFMEEHVLLPNTPELSLILRSGQPQNATTLEKKLALR
jgi:hypothetical protein